MVNKFICAIIILYVFLSLNVNAQIPTSCFEIESILVDACVPGGGCNNASSPACNCEGKNEMVRFKVGPNPLNLSNLSINWPNNSWLGLCQNATTAAHTASLNSTIQSCGLLIEPTGGILPAGANVILITSTDFCTVGNSFANLSDTMYIIFQCPGNFAGHFANYGIGLRTLTMSFGAGCSDAVTYDRALLVNQQGIPSATNGDGSTVNFDWAGNATYVNFGCQAPVIALTANATNTTPSTFCSGDSILLVGTYTGNISSMLWSGGDGVFTQANNDTTYYIIGANDVGTFNLFFTVNNCNSSVTDTLSITIQSNITSSLSVSPNDTVCQGQSVTLTASGGNNYIWNTGAQTPSINVTTSGIYSVIISDACGSDTLSQAITITPLPNPSISVSGNTTICQGDSVLLTASGGDTFIWSNGNTGTFIYVNSAGNYTVTASNNCGSSTSNAVSITVNPLPVVTISASQNAICGNQTATLTASGANSYLWNTGANTNSIIINSIGTYTVIGSNSCGNDTASISITQDTAPDANISIIGRDTICKGENVTLIASGTGNFYWNGSSIAQNSITTNQAGNYYLIATNSCGNDTAYYTIYLYNITADFTPSLLSGPIPLTVNFINNSLNANSYVWYLGENTTSNETNPSYIYNNPGEYTITLIAENNYGCKDTAEYTIKAEDYQAIYIPNVFTPNGDGKNDVFEIKGVRIKNLSCRIYNRWGEELYKWDGIDGKWDGKYKNTNVSDGVYFYLLDIEWMNGRQETKSGHITLIN
ncbi:MAG: gliding motility-associated C-terminal domain-containing protein [Bacteroidia bacterium]